MYTLKLVPCINNLPLRKCLEDYNPGYLYHNYLEIPLCHSCALKHNISKFRDISSILHPSPWAMYMELRPICSIKNCSRLAHLLLRVDTDYV